MNANCDSLGPLINYVKEFMLSLVIARKGKERKGRAGKKREVRKVRGGKGAGG